MRNLLTIQDPLAGKPIEVRLTISTSAGGRGERPVLLSLGVQGAPPVQANGRFADLDDLISEAWQRASKQSGSTPQATPEVTKDTEPKAKPVVSVADLF